MGKSLYIIDGHSHIYAAFFAPMRQRLTSPSGEPTKATYIFTTMLTGLIENHHPDMLVVAMDSKAPTFRTEIYPEYKAQRPPMPEDMPVQIQRIEQILEAMKIPMLRVEGFEADDVIGTLSKKACSRGHEVYICTKDKDVLQLLDKRVYTFDVKTGNAFNGESMQEEMHISPEQFIDVLALQGDTSDNIPGVPDVGPKTALSWIQKYGSVENLFKHSNEIKGKRGESLRNSKEAVFLGRKLVTLDCSVPIDIDYEEFAVKDFDKQELSSIFKELGFTRLLSHLSLEGKPENSQDSPGPGKKREVGGVDSAKSLQHEYHLVNTEAAFEEFIKQVGVQNLFAIDTETTSLSAMRAELVGISISWRPYEAYYLAVKAPLGSKHLDMSAVRQKLGPVLKDESVKKVGQNIKYDLLVLRNAGLPVKGICFDTMVASYCLDPQRGSHSMDNMALDFLNYECIPISAVIGKGKNQLTFDMADLGGACEYACEDADVTYRLYEYLQSRLDQEPDLGKLFEKVELPLVNVLAEMENNGVKVDVSVLKRMASEINERLEELTESIYDYAERPFNIDSPKQLAEILFDGLGLPSLRSGKSGRSTDAAVLERLAGAHPIIYLILEYRTFSKLKNTYIDKLGLLINPKTDRVHASFNQTITATGRLSSSDPNLQNIPIRTEIGRKIRSAFVPGEKDSCILSADYSQVELRLLAHFSRDKTLMEAFANDEDIHRFVASQIYNVPTDEVSREMRSRCKAVNFGIIYGQGPFGLSRTIGISQSEAKKFISDYFRRYGSIRKFMDKVIAEAKVKGYVETILHRRRKIANLNSRNSNKRSQGRRLAVNTVIQGSAADLIKVAMVNIERKIEAERLPVKMLLQIHDELVFELPATEAEQHKKWISELMAGAIELDVPLKVDVSYGESWLVK